MVKNPQSPTLWLKHHLLVLMITNILSLSVYHFFSSKSQQCLVCLILIIVIIMFLSSISLCLFSCFLVMVLITDLYVVLYIAGTFELLTTKRHLYPFIPPVSPITLLTLPMLRLLLFKDQGWKGFWKPSEPCHVGIHWIALAEPSQMSTHMPGFQSFFRFFRIILYWPNKSPAAYGFSINGLTLMLRMANLAITKWWKKKPEKLLNPWHMGTLVRVLIHFLDLFG